MVAQFLTERLGELLGEMNQPFLGCFAKLQKVPRRALGTDTPDFGKDVSRQMVYQGLMIGLS